MAASQNIFSLLQDEHHNTAPSKKSKRKKKASAPGASQAQESITESSEKSQKTTGAAEQDGFQEVWRQVNCDGASSQEPIVLR